MFLPTLDNAVSANVNIWATTFKLSATTNTFLTVTNSSANSLFARALSNPFYPCILWLLIIDYWWLWIVFYNTVSSTFTTLTDFMFSRTRLWRVLWWCLLRGRRDVARPPPGQGRGTASPSPSSPAPSGRGPQPSAWRVWPGTSAAYWDVQNHEYIRINLQRSCKLPIISRPYLNYGIKV